jgi:hypothetical protein
MTFLQTLIVAALLSVTTVMVVLLTCRGTKADIREIHLSINSRFDQFVKAAREAAWAGGRAEAQNEERQRDGERT